MKARWLIVVLALIAAGAFAMSVQAGRWWTVGPVEIGPFGARQCFSGECHPAGLGWVGGSERWARFGVATWAGGLLSMLLLLIVAAAVAANKIPRLAARTTLVSIVTALIAGVVFVLLFPGVEGARFDRGVALFVTGQLLGLAAMIGVLRARAPATV